MAKKKNALKSIFCFSKEDKFIDRMIVVLAWIFLGIIIFCAVRLALIGLNYKAASDDLNELVDLAVSQSEDDNQDPAQVTVLNTTIDFDKLAEVNDDIVGWISFEDTTINNPVVQGSDNEYYLKINFYHEWHSLGTIFADSRCTPFGEERSDNVTLYGHNVRDGTFFANLLNYKEAGYYDEHKTFKWFTPENDKGDDYVIMSYFVTNVDANAGDVFRYNDFINAKDEEAFNNYVAKCDSLGMHETQIDAVYGDDLLTLSTCDYTFDNARFVVIARKLREGETVDSFKPAT